MKGQSSIEIIIIFSLLIIVFVAIFVTSTLVLNSSTATQELSITRSSLDKIASTAYLVYLEGKGSTRQITIDFPASVSNSSINGSLIRIELRGNTPQVQYIERNTLMNISGSLPTYGGTFRLVLASNGTNVNIR